MQDGQQATFDMGIDTLHRINYWLYINNQAAAEDQVITRLKALKILYREVEPFILKKSESYPNKEGKMVSVPRVDVHATIQQEIEKAYGNYISSEKGRAELALVPVEREIFDLLDEWESEIRKDLYNEKLYMRMSEDAGSAMN